MPTDRFREVLIF